MSTRQAPYPTADPPADLINDKVEAASLHLENSERSRADNLGQNFLVMVAYQVVMRVGWIFKTESIIMPAVLDSIGGPGWLRGCLPLLNRLGQSVPPVLVHRQIRNLRLKKAGVFVASLIMGACFLLLSWLVHVRTFELPLAAPLFVSTDLRDLFREYGHQSALL